MRIYGLATAFPGMAACIAAIKVTSGMIDMARVMLQASKGLSSLVSC